MKFLFIVNFYEKGNRSLSKKILFFALSLSIFLAACKKNSSPTTPPVPSNGYIYGKAKFIDNSPASYANIQIKILGDPHSTGTICDENGNFSFPNLVAGNYIIWFASTRNDINTVKVSTILGESDTLEKDVTITYNILDDLNSIHINRDVFFMRFLPEQARIGNNYSVINYLNGYYRAGVNDSVSMSADIYQIPDSIKWDNPGDSLSATYIRNHFKYLTTVIEEPVRNTTHEIRFKDNNIKIILSNPSNGFAFVKKNDDNSTLQIPCVDHQNNDFGLIINYK